MLAVDADPTLLPYLVDRRASSRSTASVSPVSALREDGFEIALIPETLQRTTLGEATAGRRVNLEVDILAKHVQRLLQAAAPSGS